MKVILLLITLFISLNLLAKDIELKEDQFYVIAGDISMNTKDAFVYKIISMGKNKELILFIDSSGGSTIALSSMISIVDSYNIKLTCIAKYAASSAFALFQRCDKRYITTDSLFVAHNGMINLSVMNAKSFEGYFKFNDILRFQEYINESKKDFDKMCSYKLNISLKEYQDKIESGDWILTTSMALKYSAADEIVNVTCSDSLKDKVDIEDVNVGSQIIPRFIKMAIPKCPLLKPYVVKE